LEQAVRHLDTAGEILLNVGDREGAMNIIRRIIELNPPDSPRYRQLLEQLRANG
jgi:hypothetical protein